MLLYNVLFTVLSQVTVIMELKRTRLDKHIEITQMTEENDSISSIALCSYSDMYLNNNNNINNSSQESQMITDRSSISKSSISSINLSPNSNMDDQLINIKTEIKHKLLFLITFLIAMIISIYFLRDLKSAKYKILASAAFWIFIIFYINWLYLIFNAKQLHRIEIITTKLNPDFGNIIFPIQIKQYPFIPIFSMSELFAIRGSSVHLLFCIMCISIGSIVSITIVTYYIEQYQNNKNNIEYSVLLLAINSSLATPFLGNFDLNPNSKCHKIMHYVGVVMMALSVFPYGIQQNWNCLSLILIISGLTILLLWYIIKKYHNWYCNDFSVLLKSYDERYVLKRVHRISLICIILETVGCIINSFINTLFIWNLKEV